MMRSFAIALALSASATVALAAPTIVPYAGYLTDADGAPYEGTVDVRTAIYGCATDAEACPAAWQGAELNEIGVTAGMLRFELGGADDTTLVEALTGDGPLWLDIELKTEGSETWTALEPRHGLQAVPFAISAVNADQLGGMDAADYATAAELAAFTTLEDIATAGYLTDTQLADAGYLMTEALTPYVTTEALEALGYLTQGDIDTGTYMTAAEVDAKLLGNSAEGGDDEGYAKPSQITAAIADMITTTALETTLQAYVTTEALTGTLQDYITTTALTESLQPYLLAAETYTDQMAVEAVEAAGYAQLADLHARYTDLEAVNAVEAAGYLLAADKYTGSEAVAAVEAAGYALEADLHTKYTGEEAVDAVEAAGFAPTAVLLKPIALNLEGPSTSDAAIGTSDINVAVEPGEALNIMVIDLSAGAHLNYVPPTTGVNAANPQEQWNPIWECRLHVLPAEGSSLEEELVSHKSEIDTVFDVTPRTSQIRNRFHRFYLEISEVRRDEGFTLKISCNAYCYPYPGINSGCEYTTWTEASVTTF
jgi:hypothetical protein